MTVLAKIKALTRQLYPRGRAFKMPFDSTFEKLHKALSVSEAQAYSDAVSTIDSALPDNSNFSADDATDWERRLGLITNPAVSLANRKLAIERKMNHPGTIKARQHYLYLEGQLQAAGFDVYVFENRFADGFGGYFTKTPNEFSLTTYPTADQQYGDQQYGSFQYGGTPGAKVANSIYEIDDNPFDLGSNLKSTFFIGGAVAGSYADVDAEREDEFRQLILKIKPDQTVGFLLINYI